jgi:hypothetical protein
MAVHTIRATHNALLRRVDWRFLLPRPEPQRAVCFSGGPLAKALTLVSRQVASPDCLQAYGCDLAVAVNPDAGCVREASKRLRAGGVLYAEMQPAPLAVERQARWLRQAGFAEVSFYRPWPTPSQPHCWVPTNSVAAKHYLFGRPSGHRGLPYRLKGAVREQLEVARFRFSRTLPLCVIARKPPEPPGVDGLMEIVRENWPQLNAGPAPRELSQLVLTLGARSFNKVVILIFEEPQAAPLVAVKLARVPGSEAALEREADNLESVARTLGGRLQGVPRVLFRAQGYGGGTFGETAFQGVPLFTQLDRRNYRNLALKATEWLIALATAARPVSSRCVGRLTEPVVADFERCYGVVAGRELLARARDAISRLHRMPLVVEQRDFSPWNILVSAEGTLSVLDWESAQLEGLPMLDLIYFLAYLAFFFDNAHSTERRQRSYRIASDRTSFTGAIHAECYRRYADALKLHPADLHPLRLLTWMVHSRSEYKELTADRGAPSERSLRNSLFLNLWREEMAISNALAE